jgi:hypothetical protein
MAIQQYKIDVLNLYEPNGSVKSDCADITFFNAGTSNVVLNGALTINPGSSITLSANSNELDRTIYTYFFSGPGQNKFIIFRKVYL